MWQARWIWVKDGRKGHAYNETVVARKAFTLRSRVHAVIHITADAYYRLSVNGNWVCDGPAKYWPQHTRYDEVDISPYLKRGTNEVRIIARHYGAGDFRHIPQRPGLLAQIEMVSSKGRRIIGTDRSWQVAVAKAWVSNTPELSIQQEPQEYYDARIENRLLWHAAEEICAAEEGPWQDLQPRDVALLDRRPTRLHRFLGARIVRRDTLQRLCVPIARLLHPGPASANSNISRACALATVLTLPESGSIQLRSPVFHFAVDGKVSDKGAFDLAEGDHLLIAYTPSAIVQHIHNDVVLDLDSPEHATFSNPVRSSRSNGWCFLSFPESRFEADDTFHPYGRHPDLVKVDADWQNRVRELTRCSTSDSFRGSFKRFARCMPEHEMFVLDTYAAFVDREPICRCDDLVERPAAMLSDNPEMTVVHPSAEGDVELLYDLGHQCVGYWDFELTAAAGVQMDVYGVEYLYPDGSPQHTRHSRNGFRHITRRGMNRFTSLKRRGGRYVFITLRQQREPVEIRRFRCIQSTYPANVQASFACDDPALNAMWDISVRTVRLCCDDTVVDCPLYEQVFWICRNMAVFPLCAFNAVDLVQRCLRLGAESLEHLPIVGTQMPSSWNVILPLSTFHWMIALEDYYFRTGEDALLQELWPAVMKNFDGCESFVDDRGLFSGPFWSVVDGYPPGSNWEPETVLANNMLYVTGLAAAAACADILGEDADAACFRQAERRTRKAIRSTWCEERQAYPSFLDGEGSAEGFSVVDCCLALEAEMEKGARREALIGHLLDPPSWMSPCRTPLTLDDICRALDRHGRRGELLTLIRREFIPMLELGATTVWEVLPGSDKTRGTRSHCHGYSPLPVYFFPRVILGIRQTTPGGLAFEISPWIESLDWAKGSTASARGPVNVSWRRNGRRLEVEVCAPAGVDCQFVRNSSMKGLRIELKRTPR